MTPKEWAKARDRIRKHLRRSKHLSDGAFRVWDELAAGWAWSDPTCFPTYSTLAVALNRHRMTISRHIDELVEAKLLIRKRRKRGYQFTLVADIPEKFIDPAIDDNKGLASSKRKSKKTVAPDQDKMQQDCDITEQDPASRDSTSERHDVTDLQHDSGGDVTNLCGCDVTDLQHVDEVHQGGSTAKEMKLRKGEEERDPSVRASENPRGTMSGGEHEGHPTEEPMPDDLEELMEDPNEDLRKSPTFRPKQRHPDQGFVPGSGHSGIPFPEAVRGAHSASDGNFEAQVPSIFIPTPDGVLAHLRGEIETKYGRKGTRKLPDRLDPSEKIYHQIKKVLLKKYTDDVIRDMIRLIVWDWEVARGECFPFRNNEPYPSLLALVQYHEKLSALIDSGFSYPTTRRGKVNKYYDLFVRKVAYVDDDDPF